NFHQLLQEIANRNHIQIDKNAANLLESEFQENLYMLEKEVDKLVNYAGEGSAITYEIAAEVISPSKTFNALQFVDAVLQKNLYRAVKIFRELVKLLGESLGLLTLVAYQFRISCHVILMLQKGYNIDRVERVSEVQP